VLPCRSGWPADCWGEEAFCAGGGPTARKGGPGHGGFAGNRDRGRPSSREIGKRRPQEGNYQGKRHIPQALAGPSPLGSPGAGRGGGAQKPACAGPEPPPSPFGPPPTNTPATQHLPTKVRSNAKPRLLPLFIRGPAGQSCLCMGGPENGNVKYDSIGPRCSVWDSVASRKRVFSKATLWNQVPNFFPVKHFGKKRGGRFERPPPPSLRVFLPFRIWAFSDLLSEKG